MRQLRFVGLDEDGTMLVCADESGQEYLLPVEGRLRAAVRQDRTRLGQVDPGRAESTLTPREIQARIRAGETAEQVATAAGVPVERVRRFEGPVLRERERMAQDARSARLRRGGEGPWPVLGELVDQRLIARGVSPETVDWDAWRRDNSTWTVVLRFRDGAALTTAQWSFAPLRRQVAPLDEIARTLSEEERPTPGQAAGEDEVASAVAPAAVAGATAAAVRPGEPGPLAPRGPAPLRVVAASADDAPETPAEVPLTPASVTEVNRTERTVGHASVAEASAPEVHVTEAADSEAAATEAAATEVQLAEVHVTEVHVTEAAESQAAATEVRDTEVRVTEVRGTEVRVTEGEAEGPARGAGAKRRKKATVPAWDDIVFGSRRTP